MADRDGDDKRKADSSLFREATRDVRRLSTEPRHDLGRGRPPRARLSRAARVARLAGILADPQQSHTPGIATGDALSFRRDGVAEQAFRRALAAGRHAHTAGGAQGLDRSRARLARRADL